MKIIVAEIEHDFYVVRAELEVIRPPCLIGSGVYRIVKDSLVVLEHSELAGIDINTTQAYLKNPHLMRKLEDMLSEKADKDFEERRNAEREPEDLPEGA